MFKKSALLAAIIVIALVEILALAACGDTITSPVNNANTKAVAIQVSATSLSTGCGVYLAVHTSESGDPLLYPVYGPHTGPILPAELGQQSLDLYFANCSYSVTRMYQRDLTYKVSGRVDQITGAEAVKLGELGTQMMIWELVWNWDFNTNNSYLTQGPSIFNMIVPTQRSSGGFAANLTTRDTTKYEMMFSSLERVPVTVTKLNQSSRIDAAAAVSFTGTAGADRVYSMPEQTVTITASPAPTVTAYVAATENSLARPIRLSQLKMNMMQ